MGCHSHFFQLHSLTSSSAAAAAKSLQSCPTLCDPTDGSPPGSPVPGILQARTLEWVAISFSNAWKWKVKVKSLSRVPLLATPWTAAHQAPPSMGLSRQGYWSGVPLPSPTSSSRQIQKMYLPLSNINSKSISLYHNTLSWLWRQLSNTHWGSTRSLTEADMILFFREIK